jgi:hypothetical protein
MIFSPKNFKPRNGKENSMKNFLLTALLSLSLAAASFAQDGKNASKSKSSCTSKESCCPAMKDAKVTDTPKPSDNKTAKKKTAPRRVASNAAA